MTSRAALFVCLLLFAALAGPGCDEASLLRAREEHVLHRIGYGSDAWSRQRIRQLGIDAYIDEQLRPASLDDSALEARLRNRYPVLTMTLRELRRTYDSSTPSRSRIYPRRHLSEAKVLRAVHSKRQLEQVLVDFWFNHFNVDGRREIAQWAVIPYERDIIRPHVLGRFEDLLLAVVGHPAMLEYLDNAENFREGFRRELPTLGVNENFARELLELHTVGPNAGQSLSDIRNVALAFTGWTVAENLVGDDGRGFEFLADGHDQTEKRILGLTLPAGRGMQDGRSLIRYLAGRPETAVHIAEKLCRRFVAEQPTGCEVAAAVRFLATAGDLRAVMRVILESEAFRDPDHFRGKIKRPLHAVASVARAVGVNDEAHFAYLAMKEVEDMGEDLYGAGPPTGWSDSSSAWLGEGTLIRRINLGYKAVQGTRGMRTPSPVAATDPQSVTNALIDRLLLGGADPVTRAEMVRFLTDIPPSGRVREGTALLLSTPDFAKH